MYEQAAEQIFDDGAGALSEFWIECPGCGLRANVLDRLPDCGCDTRFWFVLPTMTKRVRSA